MATESKDPLFTVRFEASGLSVVGDRADSAWTTQLRLNAKVNDAMMLAAVTILLWLGAS
jgi:hypothetical protein